MMTTDETRDAPEGPAVLLFRGLGIASALIRWQTRSRYSHAAILLPGRGGTIIESWQWDGVRTKTLTDWDGIDVYDVAGMSPEKWHRAISWAQSHIGAGYDWTGVMRFLSRRRVHWDDKFFCSELVFAAMCFAGVRLLKAHPAEVSPGLMALSPLLTKRSGPQWMSLP